MAKRPRTPSEISKQRKKAAYSFSLKIASVEELKMQAAKEKVYDSELVDEAIEMYLSWIRGDIEIVEKK
jgi:hypothetical protein